MFTPFVRNRVHPDLDDEAVTKQSHKDECDIYKILKQYQRTGVLTHIAQQQPRYEDLPASVDYQEALNTIILADESFATLPASVRNEYGNDPSEFLAAFQTEEGRARLTDLGVIKKPPAPAQAPQPPPAAGAPPPQPGTSA